MQFVMHWQLQPGAVPGSPYITGSPLKPRYPLETKRIEFFEQVSA